jgi:serine protease Do
MNRVVWFFGFLSTAVFAAQPAQARRPEVREVAAAFPQPAPVPQVYAQAPEAAARGYLGIGVAEITPESANTLKLPEVRGVEITRVEEGSPAAKAGLKPDDVVLEYNGQRVEGTEQLTRMVRETPPGRQVKLVISRNGSQQTVTVTTGQARQLPVIVGGIPAPAGTEEVQRQLQEMQRKMREFRVPELPQPLMTWHSTPLGFDGEALTSQLAGYFGVTKGVLVRSVNSNSPAEKAGIKAGDVIVKVDGIDVSTPADISARIRLLGPNHTFPITLVRNRQSTTLSVTIDNDGKGPARRIKSSHLRMRPFRLVRPAWV